MQWWNDFISYLSSNDGQTVISSAVVPFVAILVAGIVAAAIGRGSTKRLLTLNDRENRIAAVATMIGAARRASVWNTLPLPEQQHADHVASEADVRVRLLAVPGSGLAADWANHEIVAMKKNSVSFSFQAEQSLIEFRDRMVTWQAKPGRARKLFKADLESWAYDDAQNKSDIVSQQQAWAAAQVKNETGPISTVKPTTADSVQAGAVGASPVSTPAVSTPAISTAAVSTPAVSTPALSTPAVSRPAVSSPAATSASAPEPTRPPERPSFAPPTRPGAATETPSSTTSESPSSSGATDGDLSHETEARPTLVEPQSRDVDRGDDLPGRSLEDALASPPITANTANRRITPPQVGDDGRSR